ncbi:MAG TPA: hypothetical protein PKY77_02415 [Phycisphaerae bacterium]|nr:hypothetical protein [Phycisphaerae bacterium]HRY66597.1 hypothetical protein [Phycisphaerae bacterium]HSA27017.1 hypothetical protein [Phycisphaerae bacterium]
MICLYYRWRISTALDSDDRSARLPERHLRRCPACRDFLERGLQLGEALREEPVSASLGIAGSGGSRPIQRAWRPVTAGLAAAACIALAVLLPTVWRSASSPPAANSDGSSVQISIPALPPLSADRLLAQVREPVRSLTLPAGGPLMREIERTQNQVAAVGRDMVACLPRAFVPRLRITD